MLKLTMAIKKLKNCKICTKLGILNKNMQYNFNKKGLKNTPLFGNIKIAKMFFGRNVVKNV